MARSWDDGRVNVGSAAAGHAGTGRAARVGGVTHGGNVYEHPGVADFSASLNPLGIPDAARAALRGCADACESYPDPDARELVAALSAYEGVDASWVVPCAGATDALWRLCQVLRPARALLYTPCYGGYEQALAQVGALVELCRAREDDGFALDVEAAEAIREDTDLVFLANPNNPTGTALRREVLLACLARVAAVGATVVVDECFAELADAQGSNDLLASCPHLVIVKALTKSFCLAGLRVGYALCSDGELARCLRAAGQTWALSVPAQVCAVACLRDPGRDEYLERSRCLVATERARLVRELERLGLQVVPSQANYLLFRGPLDLGEALLARGVMLRSCADFDGLGPGWYRVAVRAPEQDELLLAAMGEVL